LKPEIVTKLSLTNSIYNKLNKSLQKKYIYDVISIIINHITKELINKNSVSIPKFGTFSIYKYHSHKGYNIQKKQMHETSSFVTVKLRPHSNFLEMIRKRRPYLKVPPVNNV